MYKQETDVYSNATFFYNEFFIRFSQRPIFLSQSQKK